MNDQPQFQAVGGQLRRVVYQDVDLDSVETEVQEQLDAAQNQLNEATQAREQAEQVYENAEAAAEAASTALEDAKEHEGAAETLVQKSVAARDSLARAQQLATEQSEQEDTEEGDSESDEDDEELPESESTEVPVKVAA